MEYSTQTAVNQLAYEIVSCAIEVHKALGAGLLESVYEACLYRELLSRGYEVRRQMNVPIRYKGWTLDALLRLDLLVNNCVAVELKAVESMHPIYKAQTLSYMKLLEKPKGLLINFHVEVLTKGVTSLVNEYFKALPK